MREGWRTAGLIAASFVAGLGVPDIDQLLPLAHRSALTHSVFPVLLAWLHPERRVLAAGLAIGIGTHLAADSFPNAMTGYATVKWPLMGSIGRWPSYAWLATNAIAALTIGAVLVRRVLPQRAAAGLLAALAAAGAAYLFVTDGGWPALAIGGAAAVGARRWRQGCIE